MGEVSVNSPGLLPRISLLFNTPLFSDVEFIFTSNTSVGHNEKIYGHKLILSLRSKTFASMFFEKKISSSSLELPASKKASFELLFRFLYTDDVQFHTFEEAQELYDLANEYQVEELMEKCYKYMQQDKLTVNNIFSRYECALSKNVTILLLDCRDFVCAQTQLVLKSKHFINASAEVIEDIIKQDELSITSELEIITAVLKWGVEELQRKKLPADEKYLREHINQFMKYLRFLTLSSTEFDDFVEQYNILSAKESSVLTKKILQPAYNVNLPKDICPITTKRRIITKNCSTLDQSLHSNYYRFFSDSKSESLKPTASVSSKTVTNISTTSVRAVAAESVKYIKSLDSDEVRPSRVSYEVKKCSTFKEQDVLTSQIKQSKFYPALNSLSSGFSSPLSRVFEKEYSFELSEIRPCLDLSFHRDIKCSVTFKMKSGHIDLRGFELKIKNENDETDKLEVYVHTTGFSNSLSKYFNYTVYNNIFRIMFPKPMVLQEGSKGELEVSIDNLLLNRCSACNYTEGIPLELNKGLDFAVEFYLKSNKKNDNFLFPISKLLF